MKTLTLLLPLAMAVFSTGCATGASPGTPAVIGAATGASAGAAVSHGSPLGAAAGGVVGSVAGLAISASKAAAYQRGLDDGYLQGSSDAVKRLYWAKQRLENRPPPDDAETAVLAAVATDGAEGSR